MFYSLGFYAKMISDALQKTISEGQVCKINIKRVKFSTAYTVITDQGLVSGETKDASFLK